MFRALKAYMFMLATQLVQPKTADFFDSIPAELAFVAGNGTRNFLARPPETI